MPTEREIPSIRVEKSGHELLSLEIIRGENIEVRIRAAQEIESFFRTMSSGKKSNNKWLLADGTNPTYYEWKGESADALADEFMAAYLNTYGGRFFDGERANVAILRTVGISSNDGV